MKNLKDKVEEFFKNNPDAEKVHTTSDGFLFAQEMYATAHAATISDKEVLKHIKQNGQVLMATPFAKVPVSTVNNEGDEIRTKNETVSIPNVMDAPIEVTGKAEAIKEAVTNQVDGVQDTVGSPAERVSSDANMSVTEAAKIVENAAEKATAHQSATDATQEAAKVTETAKASTEKAATAQKQATGVKTNATRAKK